MRLQADVENMRKRWDQRLATDTAEARHRILNDMLPLADHLDWAMEHTPKSDDAVVKNYIGSIEATRRAFLETLRRYGIERIGEAGEAFDPNWHEAVGQAAVPGVAADHVAQVVQAGYKEGERVIRRARAGQRGRDFTAEAQRRRRDHGEKNQRNTKRQLERSFPL